MDYNRERILAIINEILMAPRISLEIAKLLLECVFVSWNKPENTVGEKYIRRFLIVDFYQILCEKHAAYIEDLRDYSKNAEEHLLIQNKIKKINEVGLLLQKKDYHDEIVYLMNILS
jgi:hypothetical protein